MTAEELKARLNYNPETGVFRWVDGPRAGMPAGSIVGVGDRAGNRYIQIFLEGRKFYAHRLAWLYVTGEMPTLKVGHTNGDGLDNRWVNLVHVSAFESQHRCARGPLGKNIYPGVVASGSRFGAKIKVRGKRKWLGTYETPELAYAAYREAKRQLIA